MAVRTCSDCPGVPAAEFSLPRARGGTLRQLCCFPCPTAPLLRLEGLALGALAVWGFALTDAAWWLFAALALAPDLGMLGYLGGPRLGAATYNAVHTYAAPAVLVAVAIVAGWTWGLPVACIWAAHIGLDRALGYGLKLPDGFQHTHLGTIGRRDA